jgi:AAA ATPase domain
MAYKLKDFVDREHHLSGLHQAVQQGAWRIVLIQGRQGIGKTYLLEEFQAELNAGELALANLNLEERIDEQNYYSLITSIRGQLGRNNFPNLLQAIQAVQQLQEQTASAVLPADQALRSREKAEGREAGPAQGSSYTFTGKVDARHAQFISAEEVHIHNTIQYGAIFEQDSVHDDLTEALREDLIQISAGKSIVLVFDHWEMANNSTRTWLSQTLFRWALTDSRLRLLIIVAASLQPDWYQEREELKEMPVLELPDLAVREYWLKIKGLPEDELVVSLYRYPYLLKTAADEALRRLKVAR